MKLFNSVLSLFILLISFSSCSSEDTPDEDQQFAEDIIGTWYVKDCSGDEFTFYSDGTVQNVGANVYYGRYILSGETLEIITDSWVTSKIVTIKSISEDEMIWSEIWDNEKLQMSFINEEACLNE